MLLYSNSGVNNDKGTKNMFKTQEQISEVAERNNISSELVRKLGQMMSKVKIAQEDLRDVGKTDKFFVDANIKNANQNLKEALTYFENDFLKCKLW